MLRKSCQNGCALCGVYATLLEIDGHISGHLLRLLHVYTHH